MLLSAFKGQEQPSLGWEDISGKEMLDIGTGAGYLPYLANKQGAIASALDIRVPIYKACTEDLKVPVLYHRIMPKKDLPLEHGSMDIITSYQTCFHKQHNWGICEWSYFLENIKEILKKDGFFMMQINHQGDLGIAARSFTYKRSGTTWRFF